jgi:hypothetical protein
MGAEDRGGSGQVTQETTLEEYERAKAELAASQHRWANDSSNNPDKYASEFRAAKEKVARLERELKRRGLLPLSETEQLYLALDRAFPNARSKEVVVYEGVRYRRRFFPATRTNSGENVRTWETSWERIGEGSDNGE